MLGCLGVSRQSLSSIKERGSVTTPHQLSFASLFIFPGSATPRSVSLTDCSSSPQLQ